MSLLLALSAQSEPVVVVAYFAVEGGASASTFSAGSVTAGVSADPGPARMSSADEGSTRAETLG